MRTAIWVFSGLTLLLTACPGGTGPAPLSVSGKVLDTGGAPVAGVPVLLGDATTTTDASGAFSGTVKAPYRLAVVVPQRNDPSGREALVYEGVTRPDPVVVAQVWATRTAALTVNFSGSVAPGGTNGGAMVLAGWSGATIDPGATYTRNWTWYGPPTLSAPLCLLRMGDQQAPKFTGFGHLTSVMLRDGQPVSYGVTLSPTQTVNFSGTAVVPSGYKLGNVSGGFNCGRDGGPTISNDASGTTGFSVPLPLLPVPLWVAASATKGDASAYTRRTGITQGSSLALSAPAAPEFVGPADNSVGLTPASEFSWMPFAGGLSTARFTPASPGGLLYTVVTAGGNVRLPDLGPLGYPFPKGAVYTWRVTGLAPVTGVDVWLSGQPFDYSKDHSFGFAGPRQFTTAP